MRFSTLEKVVPSGIPYDREKISEYIKELRHTLSRAMDETTQKARKEPPGNWQESHPLITVSVDGKNELYPGIVELSATLICKDVISRANDRNVQYHVISAIVEMHITSVFIRTGQYWYPYDLTPTILRKDEVEAEKHATLTN